MASSAAVGHRGASVSKALAAAVSSGSGFTQTTNPADLTQGPQTANEALTPTGTFKPSALKRQMFVARYVGPYSIIPGATTTQAFQTLIQGAGTANTMLHSDFQARIVTPTDPTAPFAGVSSIFDRNLNTNTVLGLDIAGPAGNVDSAGRPNKFTSVSVDVNESAGTYDEASSQGVITIKYEPSNKHTRGVISQGTAIVTIHAQIYTSGASFILRNASLDP
jgi:hypothetical protein